MGFRAFYAATMRPIRTTPLSSYGYLFLLLVLTSAASDAPKEGCYERIAVGRRIPPSKVISSSVPALTLSRCKEACDAHPGGLCDSFAFGIGKKRNATCELGTYGSSWSIDSVPPFVRIESTSTLKLNASPSPSTASKGPGTNETTAPSVANATNTTGNASKPSQPNAASNATKENFTAANNNSSLKNETKVDGEDASQNDADVDFDLYVRRPSSLCQNSPGGIDPWILRPLPSSPPSSLPPSPSSLPPSPSSPPSAFPPSPSPFQPSRPSPSPSHPSHPNHPYGNSRFPPPSVHLKPPPLFPHPSHPSVPPYLPRPSQPPPPPHHVPSATYLPPIPEEAGGPQYRPFSPPSHHFPSNHVGHYGPNNLPQGGGGGTGGFGGGGYPGPGSHEHYHPQEGGEGWDRGGGAVGEQIDCFRRVGMGRLIPDSFVHHSLHSPSLEHCRVACTSERHFRCEGFAYRWEVAACQLTAAPLSALEFRDHSNGGRVEFFARDIPEHGRCPTVGQTATGPPSTGNGWREEAGPTGHGGEDSSSRRPSWRPNYGPLGGGHRGSGGYGADFAGRPNQGGATLPGFYGPSRRDPTPLPPTEQTVRGDGFSYGSGGSGSWGGGGWRGDHGGGNDILGGGGRDTVPSSPPSAHPPDRFPDADSPGGVWHQEQRPGGWAREPECFVMVKRGFRLTPDGRPHPAPSNHEEAHQGDLLFVSMRVRSRTPYECAQQCFRSRQFNCEAFSYRYNGDPRTQGLSNCDLSGQPLQKLDPYKDLVQDRDYDVYGRTFGRACGEDAILMGPLDNDNRPLDNGYNRPLDNGYKRPSPTSSPNRGEGDVHGSHHFPLPRPPPPSRPISTTQPSYLDNSLGTGPGSGWSDPDSSEKDHRGGQDITVGGQPCAPGSSCTRHPDGGFWGCPVSSLDTGRTAKAGPSKDWDYCCRPGHQCGYSEGYHLPWCYVGSADRDQWRPCSQEHYPRPSGTSFGANTTGNNHHHHHSPDNINSFAYLHNKPPKTGNYTPVHNEEHSPHTIPSSSPASSEEDVSKPISNEEVKDAVIQHVFNLLNGKDKTAHTHSEDNKLSLSTKTDKGASSRAGRTENRAYGRRAEQVRYFHPVSSSSSSHHSDHSSEDISLENEETRILLSNFTVVDTADA